MFRFRVWLKRTVKRPLVVTAEELRQLSEPVSTVGAKNYALHQIAFNRVSGSSVSDDNTPWGVDSVEEVDVPDALERLTALIATKFEVDAKAVTVFHHVIADSKLPDMNEISDISITLKESDEVSSGIGFNVHDHAEVILWCERYLKVAYKLHWQGVETDAFTIALGEIGAEIGRAIDNVKFSAGEALMLLEYRKSKGLID